VKTILMSGSGPAVYGIVSSRKEALSVRRRLGARNKAWQVFVAQTV
jgi:4-diphosphocytidyl-2C-methyl-D-erythritol kinase